MGQLETQRAGAWCRATASNAFHPAFFMVRDDGDGPERGAASGPRGGESEAPPRRAATMQPQRDPYSPRRSDTASDVSDEGGNLSRDRRET